MPETRAEYKRKWREKHLAHARGRDAAYREKNREKIRASHRAWSERNREKIRMRGAKYRAENAEKISARQKERYDAGLGAIYSKNYYIKNRDQIQEKQARYKAEHKNELRDKNKAYRQERLGELRAKDRKYKKEHPDEVRARNRRRRARKRGVDEKFDRAKECFVRGFWGHRCAVCGRSRTLFERRFPIDHWRPLSKGHALAIGNAVLMCPEHNGEKRDSWACDVFDAETVSRIERRLQEQGKLYETTYLSAPS